MPKPNGTPISITLYDAQDQPIKTYTRLIVPWGLLKRAMQLSRQVDLDNLEQDGEEGIDAIAALVVELFGGQFGVMDLEQGADITDMVAVIQMVIAKAAAAMPANPTLPATKRR